LTETFRDAMSTHEAPVTGKGRGESESAELLKRVLRIVADPQHALQYTGPASPSASVMYGAAGIAYAAYRTACAREDARLLACADAWAERAAAEKGDEAFYRSEIQITPDTVGRVSPYHTASGVAAVRAMLANARGDAYYLDMALSEYLQLTAEEGSNPDLILGQGSILLTLTNLLEMLGPERPRGLVERGKRISTELQRRIEDEPRITDGGSTSYLGIARGWAGLLYTILRWRRLIDERPLADIEARLHQLVERAQFTRRGARWPVQAKMGSPTRPGWCNGSAGYAHLWVLAHQMYGDRLYLDLAERAAMDAFEGSSGGHAICCGFAGQAYAQVSLYKHTGERMWLDQARALTRKAAAAGNAILRRRDQGLPYSLYKGDVGVAVLIAEMEKPETAALPFFEAEP
jgi:serine/threonine-protein kinase